MVDKDFYKQKKIERHQKITNDSLKKKIEKTRRELNNIIVKKGDIVGNRQILEISKKLDELISEYMKNR